MRLLIDGNIILDVLQKREPHFEDSAKIWKLCETEQAQGYVSVLTFANLVYVMRRELDPEQIEDVRKGPALISLHDIQRNRAFAGTPVADTDCIGIRHAESLPA